MQGKLLEQGIGKLGFGFMRLPEIDGVIDIEQVKQMTDLYIENGYSYFDTAYGYHGGKSEVAIKTAVIDRHPRDKVRIATKLPLWNIDADYKAIFAEQLARTGAGYFDFYLFHGFSLERSRHEKMKEIFDFIKTQKEKGIIRHFGFSTHDSAENMERLIVEHPEFEFVQFQLNYADWDSDSVQSRKCYEAARKHHIPIIVMEPVRGGTLNTLPDEAAALLKGINPGESLASWAIRYCLSMDGVLTILSGMSSLEQVRDNIKTFADKRPLSEEEQAAVAKAVEVIRSIDQIPCTDCRYCVEECPQKINIPGYLHVANEYKIYRNQTTARRHMGFIQRGGGTPADCTACGACERKCPQHVPVIDAFKDLKSVFFS